MSSTINARTGKVLSVAGLDVPARSLKKAVEELERRMIVRFSRRHFLGAVPAALCAQTARPAIDRRAVVERHNPVLGAFDGRSPLSVGNGEFAFTADLTGLQTFPGLYDQQMPLCTLSQWGWHTVPNPSGKGPSDLRLAMFDTYGRKVGYASSSEGQVPLFNWLRENPHRLHLGKIGFLIEKPGDVTAARQTLPSAAGCASAP